MEAELENKIHKASYICYFGFSVEFHFLANVQHNLLEQKIGIHIFFSLKLKLAVKGFVMQRTLNCNITDQNISCTNIKAKSRNVHV